MSPRVDLSGALLFQNVAEAEGGSSNKDVNKILSTSLHLVASQRCKTGFGQPVPDHEAQRNPADLIRYLMLEEQAAQPIAACCVATNGYGTSQAQAGALTVPVTSIAMRSAMPVPPPPHVGALA